MEHLILCQGSREVPVPRTRSVLLESKGLHVTHHLTARSLVKGPKGRSVLSPAAHARRGKVTTKEACFLTSHWIYPNVGPPV